MKKAIAILGLVLSTASAWAAENFKMMGAKELSSLLAKDKSVQVYDVNNAEVRGRDGIIPGAKLLSSSSKFDVSKDLPADKSSKLVFYCANTKCTASHKAAERAQEAGYKDVNVMSDGIQGWVKAGYKISKAPAS